MAFDFSQSINDGLAYGAEKLKIKDEINSILNDFCSSLQEILKKETGRPITVYKGYKEIKEKQSMMAALHFAEPQIVDRYYGVFISANSYNHEYLIFKYEINEASGYPCSIKYSSKNVTCNSDADLAGCLEKMVKQQGLMIREKVREIELFFSKQDVE